MNLTVNYIPENWKPNDTEAFNKWIDKIHEHVKNTKL